MARQLEMNRETALTLVTILIKYFPGLLGENTHVDNADVVNVIRSLLKSTDHLNKYLSEIV